MRDNIQVSSECIQEAAGCSGRLLLGGFDPFVTLYLKPGLPSQFPDITFVEKDDLEMHEDQECFQNILVVQVTIYPGTKLPLHFSRECKMTVGKTYCSITALTLLHGRKTYHGDFSAYLGTPFPFNVPSLLGKPIFLPKNIIFMCSTSTETLCCKYDMMSPNGQPTPTCQNQSIQ